MKPAHAVIVIIIFSTCLMSGAMLYIFHEQDTKYTFDPNDFTYMAHYVKFHIYPEREGISIAAWASDMFPPTVSHTDNNSEVVFPMISSAEYNILIDDNKCSYYIYPVESYYDIDCSGGKK